MFGQVKAITYTIEWQKRGLPHVHLLVWVEDKLRLDEVDKAIRAELPDPTEDPELFKIVTTCMVHGPCGTDDGFYKGCLDKGKCEKGYPKPFTKETQTATDGYPMYRRRKKEDGGHEAKIWIGKGQHRKTFTLTNQWIVPYNPSLSRFFKTHINVELCNSIKAIKYVCKYINKGSDMAVMGLENVDKGDEISLYQIARYLSTNEAFWKLYGLKIHFQWPPVLSLAVHLENGQRVYYNPDDPNLQQRLSTPPETTLTAFFKLNAVDEFARTLLYGEIPEHYTWNTTNRVWKKRKTSAKSLGRVYAVHPIHAECFNLRLLLHTVRGPTSFEHLRTVNGKVCSTYQEACGLLGLLEDDAQWDKALAECDETCSAAELRNLFAMILAVCSPSRPGTLWEKFKDSMCEDILHHAQKGIQGIDVHLSDVMINECLIRIDDTLRQISKLDLSHFAEYGIPTPDRENACIIDTDIIRETSYEIDLDDIQVKESQLLNEQRQAYDRICDSVKSDNGDIFFLDAPGGTGKTFLLNLILAKIRQQNKIALAVASSGIAATLLEGGKTAHSTFGL